MTVLSFGSTLRRCATASSSKFAVVVLILATLVGEASSIGLLATKRCVSGVTNIAFVPVGTAKRFKGGGVLPFTS